MKIETVKVNGVVVNVGDEESAAKWGKGGKKAAESVAEEPEAVVEESEPVAEPEAAEEAPAKGGKSKDK
jgi:hypothetical protein